MAIGETVYCIDTDE